MNKRQVLGVLLGIAALLDVLIYRGNYLYYKAKERTANIEIKIRVLEKGRRIMVMNSLVDLELGKAYFDRGVNRLGDLDRRDQDFEKAYDRFLRSLKMNPFSPEGHFYFAQSLQYMEFMDFSTPDNSLEEYKKAVRLSGRDTEIYAEVGKAMLARWPGLSAVDRRLTLEILKEILASKNLEMTTAVLNLWHAYVKDFTVMEKILPDDAAVYRRYAEFLGERSSSREERLKYLSLAESLEFQKARNELSAGLSDLSVFRIKDATTRFHSALARLQGIHFYQDLVQANLIDHLEFKNALKAASLALAKCKIEETRSLKDALPSLRSYLDLEDQLSGAAGLEKYLKERSLLEDESGLTPKNLPLFSFQLLLAYKQNRYRDVVQAGQALESSVLLIPEGAKNEYAGILELIGDSYQKLDYLYESNNFYRKSSAIVGPGIGLLVKIRKNLARLNDTEGLRTIEREIQKIASGKEILASGTIMAPGEMLTRVLTLDGKSIRLSLSFEEALPEPFPLLSISFDGRIVWENYLMEPALSLVLPSKVGSNNLGIQVFNRPVKLLNIALATGIEPSALR